MTSRPSTAARYLTIALAVFAIIVVLVGTYTSGYLWLPNTTYWSDAGGAYANSYQLRYPTEKIVTVDRDYSQQWMTTVFRPAAKVEAWLRVIEVHMTWSGEGTTSQLPTLTPPTPAPIIHIADYHWVPEGGHGDGSYADFLGLVEQIQQQQMDAIRRTGRCEVWIEGQSDQTIDDFRAHVENLKSVELPTGDSPANELVRDAHREGLLQIGAAGRLLLSGEIDNVLPLEDHDAWQAAKPVNGEVDWNANSTREQTMANRLPPGAVIVLGAGHDLDPYLSFSGIPVRVVRVEALPKR